MANFNTAIDLTKKQFDACFPHATKANLDKFWPFVNSNLTKYEINAGPQPARRIAAFFAQVSHESNSLSKVRENLNYKEAQRLLDVFPRDFKDIEDAKRYVGKPEQIANRVYANQGGNGPESSGDGWKYKGHGLIQITTKDNHREMGEIMKLDLVGNPDLLELPENAFKSACIFWNSRGLNRRADIDAFEAITKKINGALNGYPDRLVRWGECKMALNVK